MSIWVEITEVKGSAPRDAGTVMAITRNGIRGTIGGGALELRAIEIARAMLANGASERTERLSLGPGIGQCCGGAVALHFGRTAKPIARAGDLPVLDKAGLSASSPLWIWGAGHVGRAIVDEMSEVPDADVTWVDTSDDRFPARLPTVVTPLVAADPVRVVDHAPRDADHLVLTYSHAIDLALCHALLAHGFRSVGLIGSKTKWARFQNRLSALGHGQDAICRITCPIGDRSLGKHPKAIAVGVVAGLVAQEVMG